MQNTGGRLSFYIPVTYKPPTGKKWNRKTKHSGNLETNSMVIAINTVLPSQTWIFDGLVLDLYAVC